MRNSYSHSQRMVDVVVRDASNRILRGPLPPEEFLDYQEQNEVFEDVAGTVTETMYWASEGGTERFSVGWVTPNTLAFLGVAPLFGRSFDAIDAKPDAPRVGVLNHRTWVRLFGGDRGVVGRTIVLNGEPRTIVGVMPPRFEWHVADVWIPGPLSRADDPKLARSGRWFQARLRPGVSVKEAEAHMNLLAARSRDVRPGHRHRGRDRPVRVLGAGPPRRSCRADRRTATRVGNIGDC